MMNHTKKRAFNQLLSLAIVLSLVMLFGLLCGNVWAAETGTCGDNLTWSLDSTGTLTISGSGDMANFGDDDESRAPWRKYSDNIRKVIIKDGVTSIDYAFPYCTNLTSVTIPDSVDYIYWYSFKGCSSLTDVTIPNGVEVIGNYAFAETGLTSVILPESVTGIGASAFKSCVNLSSVTMLSSPGIDEYAFANCPKLVNVSLPEDVALGYPDNAFANTPWGDALDKGKCGKNLTWILDTEGTLTIRGSGKINSYPAGLDIPWYQNRSDIQKVVMESGVTGIGDYTFSYCSNLTSVSIPDTVTSIGSHAFYGCSKLTGITIPSGVTCIGDAAFAFGSSLTSVTIPNGITAISDSTFESCSGLTAVCIPDSVISIGNRAFFDCSSLTRVTLPAGVTSIGKEVFASCPKLTSINIPDGVTSIEDDAFSSSGLISIHIPNSVTSIGDRAFSACASLTELDIPGSVTSIGYEAFGGCSDLGSVIMRNGVTNIAGYAFYYCENLTSVTIPNSIRTIGDNAFDACVKLTSVTIPDGTANLENAFGNTPWFRTNRNKLFMCTVTLNVNSYTYDGTAKKPAVTVKSYDSTTLEPFVHYTVAYSNNTNAGTATVTVTGTGTEDYGYSGSVTKTFKINPASLSKAAVTVTWPTYTGSALKPAPTVKLGSTTLKARTDYTVAYKNNTNAGTATVTATGKGNYTGTASKSFTVKAANLAGKKLVLNKTAFTYNGKVQKPTVKTVGGKALKSGTDYTVKYSNASSKAVGSYTVTVTGKGNYTGTSAKATYTINKAANPLTVKGKTANVTYSKTKNRTIAKAKAYTVSKAQGAVTYAKTQGSKKITVEKETGKLTVKKGLNKGEYTVKVKVTAAGNANYKAGNKTATVTIKVA